MARPPLHTVTGWPRSTCCGAATQRLHLCGMGVCTDVGRDSCWEWHASVAWGVCMGMCSGQNICAAGVSLSGCLNMSAQVCNRFHPSVGVTDSWQPTVISYKLSAKLSQLNSCEPLPALVQYCAGTAQ